MRPCIFRYNDHICVDKRKQVKTAGPYQFRYLDCDSSAARAASLPILELCQFRYLGPYMFESRIISVMTLWPCHSRDHIRYLSHVSSAVWAASFQVTQPCNQIPGSCDFRYLGHISVGTLAMSVQLPGLHHLRLLGHVVRYLGHLISDIIVWITESCQFRPGLCQYTKLCHLIPRPY